ncbi:MAG: hypothetical protein QME74_03800 [Candidatus Edwardsbacteria bacterium]|nr:hypothetical protein [Candidatus Edwardsbacteria bacterium]
MMGLAPACERPRQRFHFEQFEGSILSCPADRYDSLECFKLSPDGFTISFLGKKDGKWHFVYSSGWRLKTRDNAEIRFSSLDTGRTIALSPDSAHVALVYRRFSHWRDRGPHPADESGGQWFVEVDRHIFGGFDRDFKPAVHFARDGALFGFPYKKMGQYYVQISDTTFGPYNSADVAFTKDGEIILGYLSQDRAFIDMVKSQDDSVRVNP